MSKSFMAKRANTRQLKKNVKQLKEKTKRIAILEGSAWAVMAGSGVYAITPYAVALGASNFVIGLISAFSTISSSIGDYLGSWFLQFSKSRKTQLFWSMLVQAFLWIPIGFLFLFSPGISGVSLLILYSLSSFLGSFGGSAWLSLIGDSVDEKERGTYFGKRNKVLGIVQLITSLAAGLLLNVLTKNVFIGFITIFAASFVFRAISAYLLNQYWEPLFKKQRVSLLKTIEFPKDPYFRNFIILSAGLIFATNVGSPFMSVYMLKDLRFDYLSFSIATIASVVSTLITNPYWGKVIDKYGTRPVLFATSSLIVLIPFLWILSTDLLGVVLTQLYSGFVWAGFNLSIVNFLFRVAPHDKIPAYAAHTNGISDISTFLGASVGSLMVLFLNGAPLFFMSTLQVTFFVSGILRLLFVAYALPNLSKNMAVRGDRFLLRVVTVYPIKGMQMELMSLHDTFTSLIGLPKKLRR